MRFIPFLSKVPKENKTYLAKIRHSDGVWYNGLIWYTYYDGEHVLRDNAGFYPDPEDVKYLCEEEVEEYEAEILID